MNYLQEIIKLVKNNALHIPEGKYFNIVFLLKDFACQDMVPRDDMAEKYGVAKGETVKAGSAPRLAHARSEIYWATVCFPYMINHLHDHSAQVPMRFIMTNPEALIIHDNNIFLAHPTVLVPKRNIKDAVSFYRDFADNGEKPERQKDFIFDASRFFHVMPNDGYLPLKENTLIITISAPNDFSAKLTMAIGLQKAEDNGITVIEPPRYWFPDYMFKTHGYADAKAMAAKLLPEHYPPTCSGRILFEAVQFLKRHQNIVIKPSSGANGYGVHFFDIRGLEGEERKKDIEKFEKIYTEYLTKFPEPVNIIVQPYLDGIYENGEIRVFIYGGKILPVGIKLRPESKTAMCKIFLNASLEPVFLTEEYLEVAKKFIDRSKDVGLQYFGLDLIKSKGSDGLDKVAITEANFMVSGFFDHIARKMDEDCDAMIAHVDALPEELSSYIETSYLNGTVYKLFYEFISKLSLKKHIHNTHFFGDDFVKMLGDMKEESQRKQHK